MNINSSLVVLLSLILPALIAGCNEETSLASSTTKKTERVSTGWGKWVKWSDPVFRGQYPLVGDPSVLRDGKMLRMYYTCFDPDKKGPLICQATSSDGFSWENVKTGDEIVRGRMLKTRTGKWEDTHETAFAMRHDGRYFLYYSGYVDRGGGSVNSPPAYLGLATSNDGLQFTPISRDPILRTSSRGHDNDGIFSPTIVKHDGKLYMVYTGHCWRDCPKGQGVQLLGATSEDGINWTKFDTPLLVGAKLPPFFKKWAGEAELVKGPDSWFYLFYTALQGDNPHMLGIARSRAPFGPWDMGVDPIVLPQSENFDEAQVVAPSVLIEDGKVRVWFSGFTKKGTIAIGYTEAEWPLKR